MMMMIKSEHIRKVKCPIYRFANVCIKFIMSGSRIWKLFSFQASQGMSFSIRATQLAGDYREAGNKENARRRALFFSIQVHVRSFLSPIIARGTQEDINALAYVEKRTFRLCPRKRGRFLLTRVKADGGAALAVDNCSLLPAIGRLK